MKNEVTALEVFQELKKMYINLFEREMALKESIKLTNDEDDFTIHYLDDNSCMIRFNANERNNYTNSSFVIKDGKQVSADNVFAISSIKNIIGIYYQFMAFKDLYRLMDSKYTIPFAEGCEITIGGHTFKISNRIYRFKIDYIDEKVTAYDNTIVYDRHLSYNLSISKELHDIFQEPIELEKLPDFLKEKFIKESEENKGRQLTKRQNP